MLKKGCQGTGQLTSYNKGGLVGSRENRKKMGWNQEKSKRWPGIQEKVTKSEVKGNENWQEETEKTRNDLNVTQGQWSF
jgi:hypothetical protein